ncbi:MAG: aconitate hydratase, partial [Flavobacteriaceae bacterium]|nr:aconitate hydratase [Flavobacteriaceae bacterium]
MAFDIDMIKQNYAKLEERITIAKNILNRPLTSSEKILYAHLWDKNPTQSFTRGADYVNFAPDRIACQDATAQMALLQFMQAGKSRAAV